MTRRNLILALLALAFAGLSIAATQTFPAPTAIVPVTGTPTVSRLTQPPTVSPPLQADNGAQAYWSMCSDCHGDHAQGLTEEWRASFDPQLRDCWKSGCHGGDHPQNSFEILKAGAPALTGAGKLTRFTTAFELYDYIQTSMPLSPAGSLSAETAWALTAYILRLNDRQPAGFTLNPVNSSAIPVHRAVRLPTGTLSGVLLLVAVLGLAALGLSRQVSLEPSAPVVRAPRPNFFHHLHPPSLPAEQSRLRYTLGAGGLALFLCIILLVTGLLETYYYIPTPGQAAVSIATLTTLVPFGALIRNLHYWAAQFLVLVVSIHLLRVVLTGAYAHPRRFNYLIGLVLLVLVLLLDFTGYVLRWDEGIRWALVVGTNLLKTIPWIGPGLYQFTIGGDAPGPATLTRFYAWHIFGLALIAGVFIIWHLFRVRRDGGVAVPPVTERQGKQRITRFELLRRELLVMTLAGAFLLFFAALVPAPLAPPIQASSLLTGESRAPWFFLWVQQLLRLGDPFLWGVFLPILAVLLLGLLPYLLPVAGNSELGRWFPRGNRLARILALLIFSLILALTLWGAFFG